MNRILPVVAALGVFAILLCFAFGADRQYTVIASEGEAALRPKRVLFFGYNDAEQFVFHTPRFLYDALREDFEKFQIQLTFTDDLAALNPATLAAYDAVLAYGYRRVNDIGATTALVDFVEAGGGFVAVHAAGWSFPTSVPYESLLGGRVRGHKPLTVYSQTYPEVDPPILAGLEPYTSEDEPYEHRDLSPDIKVLSWRDAVGATEIGNNHQEPYTWVRTQGLGRVFYHAGGHAMSTWRQAGFRELLARGVHWVSGGAAQPTFGARDPRVSDSGTVLFDGESDGASAIWRASSASDLAQVARSGDPGPAGSGGSWDLPAAVFPTNTGDGEISFIAGLDQGEAGTFLTLISEQDGLLSAILADGEPISDLGAGVTVALATPATSAHFAASTDQILARVHLQGTGSFLDDTAILSLVEGAASVLAREGDPVPGLPGGVVFGDLSEVEISMGQDGAWAMAVPIAGVGVTEANDSGVIKGDTGSTTAFLREGSALATLPGIVLGEIAVAKVAGGGRVLLNAGLAGAVSSGDDAALLTWTPADGSLLAMLREGDPAGAGNLKWSGSRADSWECNQSGEVILAARLTGAGISPENDEGIWFKNTNSFYPLALEGQSAPGGQAGMVFAGGLDVARICITDGARVAFLAPTWVGALPGAAVFAGTAGAIATVLRPGDSIDIGGGSDTISAVSLAGGGASSGLSGKRLVLRVDLTGGGSAIVLIQDVLDLDGDGVADFLELAFGTDPDVATDGQSGLPRMIYAGGEAALEFRRQVEPGPIVYLLEESPDLINWFPSTASLELAADQSGLPAGFERVIATVGEDRPRRFYRLRITGS